MGGPGASGDLETGSRTQAWLAVSNDPAAAVSGGYWHHQQRQGPAPEARDPAFQDKLMDRPAPPPGIKLFLPPSHHAQSEKKAQTPPQSAAASRPAPAPPPPGPAPFRGAERSH